jgi:hypothetical protein
VPEKWSPQWGLELTTFQKLFLGRHSQRQPDPCFSQR